MKERTTILGMILAIAAFEGVVISGLAQSAMVSVPTPAAAPAKPAPLSSTEQWIKDVKNPAPWFSWGGDMRIRDEYYNNAASLSEVDPLHEQNVIRFRGRLWASVVPVTNVSVNTRLSAEAREWTRPSFVGAFRGQQGMEWRYGLFDNLNLKWNNVLDQPLSLTVGRQDILLGDYWNWWLVADGTPGDGSWSYYLDSARLGYEVKDWKTKFDLIYIHQNARPDDVLPVLNANQDAYSLTEQNEEGVIVYASNKSLKNTQIDAYFMYKGDDREFANGDNADIFTLGARVVGTFGKSWQYALEGGYQFGEKQDPMVRTPVDVSAEWRDISAFGVNGRLSYMFKDRLNNQAHLVYEYLSGDDPSTEGKDEMWDVLWGRWPRWSELYIYSYIQETGGKIAQLNNIQRLGVGWTLSPMKNMHLGAYYNALFAPEEVATRTINATRFSGDGNFRGHYAQMVLRHQFSRHVAGHLWGECVWEGDYYAQRDLMSFLRAEVQFTF